MPHPSFPRQCLMSNGFDFTVRAACPNIEAGRASSQHVVVIAVDIPNDFTGKGVDFKITPSIDPDFHIAFFPICPYRHQIDPSPNVYSLSHFELKSNLGLIHSIHGSFWCLVKVPVYLALFYFIDPTQNPRASLERVSSQRPPLPTFCAFFHFLEPQLPCPKL